MCAFLYALLLINIQKGLKNYTFMGSYLKVILLFVIREKNAMSNKVFRNKIKQTASIQDAVTTAFPVHIS